MSGYRATLPALGHKYVDIYTSHRSHLIYRPKVAVDRTQPDGRVLGVDIIPAQPPKGVSTIQGNFLAPGIQEYVQDFLSDPRRGRPRSANSLSAVSSTDMLSELSIKDAARDGEEPAVRRTVDVVLSDMSAPWHQTDGFWKRSLSDPYYRMMNTTGVALADHAGSMVCAFDGLLCVIR